MVDGRRYDVAFVVVTYNAAQYIRKCVESIRAHFPASGRSYSIVIVDNASSDGTVDILTEIQETVAGVRVVLLEKNIGFGPANNVGFSTVPARRYALLNADAWMLADSVSPALAAMELRSEIAVCGLPLVFPDGSPQTYAFAFSSWKKWLLHLLGIRDLTLKLFHVRGLAPLLAYLPYGREFVRIHTREPLDIAHITVDKFSGALRPVDWVCGAAMLVDGDFIREVGGFDPAIFLYGEDEDLCIAAHRYGREVVIVDTAPIVHMLGWGVNRFNRRVADLKYESLRYFIRKDIDGPVARLLMTILLPLHVYGWFRFYYAWLGNTHSESCRKGRV